MLHCVDFWVFDGQVAPPERQVKAVVAIKQQQHKTLITIEMHKLNNLITKPFANGFYVSLYKTLKMFVTRLIIT